MITRQALRPNDRTQTLTMVLLDSPSIKRPLTQFPLHNLTFCQIRTLEACLP
jgi:hypothetical protein